METLALLSHEHEELLQFMYMAPVGLVQTTLDGTVLLLNPCATNLLLPLQSPARLANFFDAIEPFAPEIGDLAKSYRPRRGVVCQGVRVRLTNGLRSASSVQVLEVSLMKTDEKRFMAVLSDVTQVVEREEQVRQSAAWFNALHTDALDHAVVSLNEKAKVLNWNADARRLTGFEPTDLLGHCFGILFPDMAANQDRVRDYLADALANGWSSREGRCARSGLRPFWASSMIASMDTVGNDDGWAPYLREETAAFILVIRDISNRPEDTARGMLSSTTDHLTGVMSRRAFFDATETEIKRWKRLPRPLALLIVDVDYFKNVNDTLGHPAGDLVLCALAQAIAQESREIDLVARIGGEEFALLLPYTSQAQAVELAERIRARIESMTVEVGEREVRVTISIGLAEMSEAVGEFAQLMKCADQALYAAKKAGRNRVVMSDG